MTKYNFILLLQELIPEKEIKKVLSEIFNIDETEVVSIYEGSIGISYEIRALNKQQSDTRGLSFCYELNVFLPKDLILSSRIYNELILAKKISNILTKKIIISSKSDIPYLYLLIDKEGLFLIEDDDDQDCVSIYEKTKIKLSYIKALNMLPNRQYYLLDNTKSVYYVKNGLEWKKCST